MTGTRQLRNIGKERTGSMSGRETWWADVREKDRDVMKST